MFEKNKCQKVEIPQGAFYLGPSDEERSVGYLELKPETSLTLHNRPSGIERLTQVEGKCSMVVYDMEEGRLATLNKGDTLEITPPGTWHIHVNPFDDVSLAYWDFEGDITHIIEKIGKSAE